PAAAAPGQLTHEPAAHPAAPRPPPSPPRCASPYADPPRSSLPPLTPPHRCRCDRGGHALFQDRMAFAPLLSHATARTRQAGTSLISQAAGGRQADREPAHRTLWTLRPQTAAPAPILQ